MALVNDTFLQLVKTETHRGLEGRALAGFWTGGHCYGYRTIPEPKPQDPEHPRAMVQVYEPEARVVRRIFRAHARGDSLKSMCDELNREGLVAPSDDRPTKAVRGWSKSLFYFMLRNERYVGEFVWNRREWFRDPATGKRRYRERPESEWVRLQRPELAIVDPQTWAKVQARKKANTPGAAGPNRDRTGRQHLLSGMLRCGSCGAPMVIVGVRRKAGRTYANFACSVHTSRGASVCPNGRTIGEHKANRKILEAVRKVFDSPDFVRWVESSVAACDHERAKGKDQGRDQLELDIRSQAARVEKVTEAIAEVGVSAALRTKLTKEEERLRELRGQLAQRVPEETRAPAKVSVAAVLRVMREVVDSALSDPGRARQALAGLIQPVMMKPRPRGYRAEIRPHTRTASVAAGRPMFESTGCGGRI